MATSRGEPEEQELFCACLELSAEEREVYLARACRGRSALRRRVERLLAAHGRAERHTLVSEGPLEGVAREGERGSAEVLAGVDRSAAGKVPSSGTAGFGAARLTIARRLSRHPLAAGVGTVLLVAALVGGVAASRALRELKEARHAVEVNGFLIAALRDAAPYGVPGQPVTVPEMLRRAAARLETETRRPTEVRVELLCVLGEALLAHQDAAAAERFLRRAVAEAERSLGAGDRLSLRARVLLASARRLRGRTEGLREDLELVLPGLRAASRELAEELVTALQNLALLEVAEGRYEAAEATAKEALDAAVERLGPRHQRTASVAATLVLASLHGRDAGEALSRADAAYRLARDVHRGAPGHPTVLEAEALYGRALFDAGQVAEGLARVRDAADRAEGAFGVSSRRAGALAGELARLELRSGHVQRAVEGSAAAVEAAERSFGGDSPAYASALALHGEALLAARRLGEAIPLLERAAEVLEAAPGGAHERARVVRASLALARAYRGEAVEALRQLEQVAASASVADDRGDDRPRHVLAVVRRLAGEPAAALKLQEERLATLAARPEARLERLRARAEVGLALVDLGSYDEAVTPLLRSLAAFEELGGELTPKRADLLVALGRARVGQGRPAEAVEPLEAAERFWEGHAPESPWAAEAGEWLARCRQDLARRANARRTRSRSPAIS